MPISRVISPFTESRGASCGANFGRRPAQKLFVDLGQLARHHHRARAEGPLDGLQCLQNPMRRLIENQGGFFAGQRLQGLGPLARLGWQKPAEVEGVGGQPGSRQRGQHRRGARHGLHRDAAFNGRPHQAVARVGDQRRTRIGHQRHHRARAQARRQLLAAPGLVVVVVADGRLGDTIVVQQLAGLPGVLAGDEVGLLERAHRAIGDVFQVSDGGGDQVEQAGHDPSIGPAGYAAQGLA